MSEECKYGVVGGKGHGSTIPMSWDVKGILSVGCLENDVTKTRGHYFNFLMDFETKNS